MPMVSQNEFPELAQYACGAHNRAPSNPKTGKKTPKRFFDSGTEEVFFLNFFFNQGCENSLARAHAPNLSLLIELTNPP